jgi:hypothetical protein
LVSAKAVFRRLATSHVFERSNFAGHATPESQPRFVPKNPPCFLEIGAGLREAGGGIALMFARMRTRIEAATPFPWVGVKRVADAPRDRPDADIAVIDVPAIWPFRISAAGENTI